METLCEDIGKKLGCGAVMSSLCRVSTGPFSLDDACTLDELERMTEEEKTARLIPPEALFDDLPTVALGGFYAKLCQNGCEIYQKKINTNFRIGDKVKITIDGVFYGIGEVKDYPDGTAVKLTPRFALSFVKTVSQSKKL